MYNTATLSNGLRVIHRPSASPVVYCGYEVNAGAADEKPGYEGMAHFCEHTTFKGTARRGPLDIINSLESVGGDLNAFTTKTDTVYYAAIMNDSLPTAVDVLTDMVFHSRYPQTEIDKEVEVICDEIESYNDSPAELIYDEFENVLFHGTPLGHNILGSADRVRQFKTADALAFINRLYRPDNAVFFAYGNVDFHKLTDLLEKVFVVHPLERTADEAQTGEKSTKEGKVAGSIDNLELIAPRTYVHHMNTHQSHVMLGNRAYPVNDDRRMALYLLNNILGGPGMNSRLNLNLREANGLVYTVESTMVSYAHTGMWSVYFGCDHEDCEECLKLVRKELDKAMTQPLSEQELASAKRQIKGQIGIACDNRENFALDFGKAFLHYGWEKDIDQLFAKIDALTVEQLQNVANDIFAPEKLTTLIFK